jgi:hypothetical protein
VCRDAVEAIPGASRSLFANLFPQEWFEYGFDWEIKDGGQRAKLYPARTNKSKPVRHPPRSGWLSEWGRLKGGCPVGSVVALKRASVL